MKPSLVIAAACLAAAVSSTRADSPSLADLRVAVEGDNYVASARLQGGLTPEILEEIDAGLETTIGYRFNLYRRRTGVDETLIKRRIRCTVRHDALTRQYTLTRRIDGEVQDTQVTGDARAMRDFLTVIAHVPLVRRSELAVGQEYYLRAKSDIGFIWRFYLIPWPLDTAWARIPVGAEENATPHASP